MKITNCLIVALVLPLLSSGVAFSLEKVSKSAEDSTVAPFFKKNNVIVSINSFSEVHFGTKLRVPVKLINANLSEIERFNFLISFDPKFLSFSDVVSPRDDFSGMNCHWEEFNFDYGELANCGDSGYPAGIIRVSGYAIADSVRNEKCLDSRTDSVLFTMNFNVSNNYNYECDSSSVDFIWYDCNDNTLTVKSPEETNDTGSLHLVADRVYENENLMLAVDSFPSTTGVTGQCFRVSENDLLRGIDFHRGKVNMMCYGIQDTGGDINLNGIANEVADYNLFHDYFLYGVAVFTINPAGQIAATDVNHDGKPLGLDDLVYLNRIVVGDALPYNKLDSNLEAIIQIDKSNQKVYLLSNPPIKHIWLQVGGNIVPHSKSISRKVLYNYVEPYTNILITEPGSFQNGQVELFHYTGKGEVLEGQAATRDGAAVRLIIENLRVDP